MLVLNSDTEEALVSQDEDIYGAYTGIKGIPIPGEGAVGGYWDIENRFNRKVVGSAGSPDGHPLMHSRKLPFMKGIPLANPFKQTNIDPNIKTAWYRRRWAHVFPLGFILLPKSRSSMHALQTLRDSCANGVYIGSKIGLKCMQK